ncbi:MAG: hypothetical protein QOF94_1857 [Acidobacteriaceae bacterium]|jgi:hypothetical protein|nr:hypothetical protein [Alphaproteobacteria bacterium]
MSKSAKSRHPNQRALTCLVCCTRSGLELARSVDARLIGARLLLNDQRTNMDARIEGGEAQE